MGQIDLAIFDFDEQGNPIPGDAQVQYLVTTRKRLAEKSPG